MRWLDRVLHYQALDGGGRGPVGCHRWTIYLWGGRRIYLHHWVGDEWTEDRHNHPSNMLSIGLWGEYFDDTDDGIIRHVAPWVRWIPATHTHRVRMYPGTTCWTLALFGPKVQPWGFWTSDGWVDEKTYHGRGE
jgi:hypothetical protein